MIGAEYLFKSVKGFMALICELERSILGLETCEGSSNLGEVCDELSIESVMAKEAFDSFHIDGRPWKHYSCLVVWDSVKLNSQTIDFGHTVLIKRYSSKVKQQP